MLRSMPRGNTPSIVASINSIMRKLDVFCATQHNANRTSYDMDYMPLKADVNVSCANITVHMMARTLDTVK